MDLSVDRHHHHNYHPHPHHHRPRHLHHHHRIRDRPELKEKPVAVGGESMISTTNYHARLKGVRSAMPGFIGRKLCPELVFVKPDYDK